MDSCGIMILQTETRNQMTSNEACIHTHTHDIRLFVSEKGYGGSR